MDSHDSLPQSTGQAAGAVNRVYWVLLAILQTVMLAELLALLFRGQWRNVAQVAIIMALTLAPVVLRARLPTRIPPEFQILTVTFVFAALFLGEVQNYYERIWWWDMSLHATSGLLFGIVGFLLVYILNENERVDMTLRPRFIALFAFVFAIAIGALWEVFEFAMDQGFGLQMQKPRLNDPSGLTDTMWDLVFDTVGALAISGFGWWYMIHKERSFVENWITRLHARHRHRFVRKGPPGAPSAQRAGEQ